MSTLKEVDPIANLLLDSIAGGVMGNRWGESGGNYNAVIGSINASDDLGKKTLSQIYELQRYLLNTKRMPSTAVGRYQFIQRTLKSLVADSGTAESEKFTPGLQDAFGLMLLKRRGYQAWLRKGISDDTFLHNLSCEWASLPDPRNGGKSHYDGDAAGNHASTTLAFMRGVLMEARRLEGKSGSGTADANALIAADLQDLQESLHAAGYYNDDIDGIFGPNTEAALWAWQRQRKG